MFYKLGEIADGMVKGGYGNDTSFVNTLGERIVVKDGALRWLTKNGYVSNIVGVTLDTVTDTWKREKDTGKELTFAEALELIDKGNKVHFETPAGEKYWVRDMAQLEDLLTLFITIGHLYSSKFYSDEGNTVVDAVNTEDTGITLELDEVKVDGLLDAFNIGKDREKGAKLTEKNVYAIHFRRTFMKDSVASLAEAFGVTERMVYYILDGTYWGDVHKQFHKDYSANG